MGFCSFMKKLFSFPDESSYDEKKEKALEDRLQEIDMDRKISSQAFMFAMEGFFERMKNDGCPKAEAERLVDNFKPPTRHLARQTVRRVYENEPLPAEEQEFRELYNQIYGNSPWMKKESQK